MPVLSGVVRGQLHDEEPYCGMSPLELMYGRCRAAMNEVEDKLEEML